MIRIDELTAEELELQRMRGSLRSKLRQQVKQRHNGVVPCTYCGMELSQSSTTLSHLHPLSRGGATTEFNVVLACRSCVDSKRDKTLEEWCRHLMIQQGEVMQLLSDRPEVNSLASSSL